MITRYRENESRNSDRVRTAEAYEKEIFYHLCRVTNYADGKPRFPVVRKFCLIQRSIHIAPSVCNTCYWYFDSARATIEIRGI